ncbi:unnamed protein product [Symbiodinium sp. CCMP2456]|nr:unnamed protein product [Symbiodinium sp. CCMP2456]
MAEELGGLRFARLYRQKGQLHFVGLDIKSKASNASKRGQRAPKEVVAFSAAARHLTGKEALRRLDELKASGVQLDVLAFNVTIAACSRSTQWRQALSLLHELQSSCTLAPDAASFSGAGSSLVRAALWEQALALPVPRLNVVSFGTLLAACEKGARWEEALQLLQHMRRLQIQATAIAMNSAIGACGRGERWESALQLYAELVEGGADAGNRTQSALMTSLARGAQWTQAIHMLQQMSSPNIVVHTATAEACARAGRWQEASTGTASAYSELLGTEWEAAMALIRNMPDQKVQPDAICYAAAVAHTQGAPAAPSLAYLAKMYGDEGASDNRSFLSKTGNVFLMRASRMGVER